MPGRPLIGASDPRCNIDHIPERHPTEEERLTVETVAVVSESGDVSRLSGDWSADMSLHRQARVLREMERVASEERRLAS